MKIKFTKFKKTVSTGVRWDSWIGNSGFFYRIHVGLSGRFFLRLCQGLHANGLTPANAKPLTDSLNLNDCIEYAQKYTEQHFAKWAIQPQKVRVEKETIINKAESVADYSDVKLPYKD